MDGLKPDPGAHRVVIVGGGFGGLHAARRLGQRGYAVTLIDKRNFQLFQPLLYQVATGSLAPGDIAIPTRSLLRRYPSVRVLQATAYDLDAGQRKLRHEHGELDYDSLIVATGVKHNYFGKDGWRAHAPGLKTVEHALEMRRRIFNAFELAELSTDPAERAALMSFVVVGAGPTGVELAGAIGELAHKTLVRDFRAIDPRQTRVLLLEGASRVLPVYPEPLSAAARRHLEQLGVTVLTGALVQAIDADGVRYQQAGVVTELRARTVLWAAGVRASLFGEVLAERTGVAVDRSGRLQVGADCSLPGHPEIFVIGDLARLADAAGRDVPGLAPAAIQQGEYVAGVIAARHAGKAARPFRYRDRGSMAVIGMNKAVGDLRHVRVTGLVGWWLWAFVHLMSLVDGAQRLRVFVQWGWKYCTRRTGDRLITGQPTDSRRLRGERLAAG
ncbi:MAG: NAD(P)/FAD-dependent oxidoreductase [Stagnimonas sp.]|nr:NAD(P)/FAD-dependent oxidoreductase [Stagnimonas sp.]